MSMIFEPYRLIDEKQSARLFNIAFVLSQCFGLCAVVSVAIWMGAYEDGGYAWSEEPEKQFHYHPTFMAVGIIFLQGEALLVYRVFRRERKSFTKLLHLVIHSLVLVFTLISLKAVWNSHDYHRDSSGNLSPLPNLYSLHSWAGISVVSFYCLQYFGGFITFFFPGLSIDFRKFFLPFHQLFGVLIFLVCSSTALMGISERAAWANTCWTVDREMCGQHFVSNFLGVCIIGFCATVLFMVMNPRWKRQPLPEEECLNILSSDEN